MVKHLQHFSECPRANYANNLETVGNVVADQWFIVVILVTEAVLVLTQMCLAPYVKDISIICDLHTLKLS